MEVGRGGDRPTAAPADAPAIDLEQAAWRAFAEATDPETFYRTWLAVQCRQVPGAVSAVVVLGAPDSGRYAPAAFWPESRRDARHLAEAAERALTERRGLVIPRTPKRPGEPGTRPRYNVAFPIQVDGRLHGVVAVDVAPRQERDLQAALRQLQWGASWLEAMFLRQEAARVATVRDRLEAVLDLVATASKQREFRPAATAFVTAVATRLSCDRVSVGFVTRGRVRVQAMSHTAQFGKATNVVRAIAAAMDEAIDQAATVVYPAPADAPARVNRMHAELSRQHGAPSICTVPLAQAGEVLGAITLERPQPFDREANALLEALAGLAGPLMELARRDDRWLPAKVAESARHAIAAVIGPRHVALKLGLVLVAVAIGVLATWEGTFRVAATTTIEPIARRAVTAPIPGYVAEAPARAGDVVRSGQLLARLDDRDLRLERTKWTSQYEQISRQYGQALAVRNAAQVVILAAQLDQARAQVELLDDQLARLRLQAPFDGVVVLGDLSQSLAAPVERGQVLYEIAPLDAYRVVAQVDERDVVSIVAGQRGTLVLAGAPADPLGFTIEQVTPVSTARESRNYFRVEAKLDRTIDRLRPGMEGVAKIEVGRRLWVWIWTRQVIDWARLQLWTWLP